MTVSPSTSSSSNQIRPARLEDAERIARVGREAFRLAFGHSCSEKDMSELLDSTYTTEQFEIELKERPNRHYIVAEVDGVIVGFASLDAKLDDEECLQGYENRVELSRVYVDHNHHGSGVGKDLVLRLFEMAREMGKVWIWLGVWEHNAKAKRFYEKLGFEQIGQHIFMVGSDAQLDWIVIKKL